LLMEFPNGVGVTAQVGMWNADADTVAIIGSRGRIDVPHAFICGPEDGDVVITRGESSEIVAADHVDHYERQVTRFSHAVVGSADLLFSPDDAIRQAEILEAVTRSRRNRERVTLG